MNKDNKKYYYFLLILFVFCVAKSFAVNVPDYDLWARLLVGQHFFETFSLMKSDIFSYTHTHFWYDHEWGSSVVFYGVLKLLGESGLTILKAVLIFFILFFINRTIIIRGVKSTTPNNILYYVITLLAMFHVLAGTIRCHLFTFLFFAIWIYLLERVRLGEKKWLYYFPLMMILWNNLHGGCVSGIGLLLIYTIGEFLNKKPVKDYLISMGLTCVATLINPYGIGYVFFLLKATTMKRPLITEWKNSFDKHYLYDYLKYKFFLLVMTIVAMVNIAIARIADSKLDKTKYILLFVTAYLSIAHIKHQPFFIITAAIFLYDDFYSIFNSLIGKLKALLNISDKFVSDFVKTKEFIVCSLVVLLSIAYLIQTDGEMKITRIKYPIYAVEFVKRNDLTGNLFVNFTYGSYAAYKLYPKNLIVMDGRYEEVYDTDLINEMRDFHKVTNNNWDKIIKNYKTDVIIIEKDYPAFVKLKQDKKWTLVFSDRDFAVFVPSASARLEYSLPPKHDWFYELNKFDHSVIFKKKY